MEKYELDKIITIVKVLRDRVNKFRILAREINIYLMSLERDIQSIERLLNSKIFAEEIPALKDDKEKDKFSLIGKLPLVLLSKDYFPDNKALIDFAKENLKLPISIRRKRSRREIIGIIITEVANLDYTKISDFRKALDTVLSKRPTTRESFFEEWEKAIKSLRFQR